MSWKSPRSEKAATAVACWVKVTNPNLRNVFDDSINTYVNSKICDVVFQCRISSPLDYGKDWYFATPVTADDVAMAAQTDAPWPEADAILLAMIEEDERDA